MKIYKSPNAEPGQRWQPTQADANRVRNGGPVEPVTVGEDGRKGMCDLLNISELQMSAPLVTVQPGPVETDHMSEGEFAAFAESKPEPLPNIKQNWEANDIEDFILNRATQAQVENIFSCLGARFAEQRKG